MNRYAWLMLIAIAPWLLAAAAPTPSSNDLFYKRYFHKGKEVKEQPTPVPAPTLAPRPPRTPTPEPDPLQNEIRELIHDLGTEQHRRIKAIERLAMIGEPALPSLHAALRHPYRFVRIGALKALAHIRHRASAPAIQGMLGDADPGVRAEAAKTLGRMQHRPSTGMVAALIRDRDPRVREEAVAALGKMGGAEASQSLIGVLQGGSLPLRRLAAQELAGYEGEAVVAALVRATESGQRALCLDAIRALGEIADSSAAPRLKALCQNPDPVVRETAKAALDNLE